MFTTLFTFFFLTIVCLLVDVCLLRSLPAFSLPRQSAANEAARHYAPEALRLVGYRPMMREYQDNVAGKAVGNYFSKVHFGLLIVHFGLLIVRVWT